MARVSFYSVAWKLRINTLVQVRGLKGLDNSPVRSLIAGDALSPLPHQVWRVAACRNAPKLYYTCQGPHQRGPSVLSDGACILSDDGLRCNLKALLLRVLPDNGPQPLPIHGGRKVLGAVGQESP